MYILTRSYEHEFSIVYVQISLLFTAKLLNVIATSPYVHRSNILLVAIAEQACLNIAWLYIYSISS